MSNTRKIRMGIDVGGTHTKAVAIDNCTHEIVGKSSVMTTHDSERGVAEGVVQSFQDCMNSNGIDPEEVVFVAHSTTQATNALLEGDVSKVGVVGMGKGGISGFLSRRQTNLDDIDLGAGKTIEIKSEYIKVKDLSESLVKKTIEDMAKDGVNVLVASMAFGVDDSTEEHMVKDLAAEVGMPTTAASDITKLYGLTRRTRTASINASILPTMLETADSTASSVKESGVDVPLMIMRGDGGVMNIEEMKKRPVLTMLSGPAASVMGALMYLRVSNGVFVEVGGTSTDISVIKDGRPAVDYSIIGGHRTFVNSLDVRVSGIAGGSMVRVDGSNVIAVGPRSAHIADQRYAAFLEPELFEGAKVVTVKPTPSDPSDYVSVELSTGELVAITTTCAANALGIPSEEDFALGNKESSQKALTLLGEFLGKSMEEVATQILDKSSEIIIPVIENLIETYDLEREQVTLIGAGGGAGPLVRHTSKLMELPFSIPDNAEVISSIGVALAMVREMVERIIPNPSQEDLIKIRREAADRAIENGATPESVEVHLEIDSTTSQVTAIALGSTEVRSADLLSECCADEAMRLAEENMPAGTVDSELLFNTDHFYIIQGVQGDRNPVRIVDKKGFIRVQRNDAKVVECIAGSYQDTVKALSESLATYTTDAVLRPDYYICAGPRVMDFDSSTDMEQLLLLMDLEMSLLDPDEEILIIGIRNNV